MPVPFYARPLFAEGKIDRFDIEWLSPSDSLLGWLHFLGLVLTGAPIAPIAPEAPSGTNGIKGPRVIDVTNAPGVSILT